jgi:hypothetical protein
MKAVLRLLLLSLVAGVSMGSACNKKDEPKTQAAPGSFTLTAAKAGNGTGTVSSNPGGVNCGSDCSEPYTDGTSVTLTATAGANSAFGGWSGACTGTGDCAVTVNSDKTATATFNATAFTMSVSVTDDGNVSAQMVTSNPAGINCPGDCTEAFPVGTTVELTQSFSTECYDFTWGGDASGSSTQSTSTTSVVMNGNKNVTAHFACSCSCGLIAAPRP